MSQKVVSSSNVDRVNREVDKLFKRTKNILFTQEYSPILDQNNLKREIHSIHSIDSTKLPKKQKKLLKKQLAKELFDKQKIVASEDAKKEELDRLRIQALELKLQEARKKDELKKAEVINQKRNNNLEEETLLITEETQGKKMYTTQKKFYKEQPKGTHDKKRPTSNFASALNAIKERSARNTVTSEVESYLPPIELTQEVKSKIKSFAKSVASEVTKEYQLKLSKQKLAKTKFQKQVEEEQDKPLYSTEEFEIQNNFENKKLEIEKRLLIEWTKQQNIPQTLVDDIDNKILDYKLQELEKNNINLEKLSIIELIKMMIKNNYDWDNISDSLLEQLVDHERKEFYSIKRFEKIAKAKKPWDYKLIIIDSKEFQRRVIEGEI